MSIGTLATVAQETENQDLGTEVVNVVKPYSPTISDAFKVKETPSLNDSVTTQKKPVKYSIFSVPVASTFTPAKGTAADVEKSKRLSLYDNYVTLGFGSYTTALAELYSNWQLSRTDNFGIFLRHNSAQGDIDNVALPADYLDTQLDMSYSSFQRDISYDFNLNASHELINWYGLNPNETFPQDVFDNIDSKQSYVSFKIGGGVALEDSYLKQARGTIRYTSDRFSSSEIHAKLMPQIVLPITEHEFLVDLDVDFLGGSFERSYLSTLTPINYSFFNLGLSPALVILNDDLTLHLGAAFYFGQDLENSDSDFFIYPKVRASYRLVDELLIAYGGLEGELRQNSFYQIKEVNPFVSPTLALAPTDQLYDGYVGLKGKLAGNIGYNIRGTYKQENNKPFFMQNPYKGASNGFEGYEFGNSFGLVYDDLSTLSAFGELKVNLNSNTAIGVNATYNNYSTEVLPSAYNLPEFTAGATLDIGFTDKIFAGGSLFFVGERTDVLSDTFINTLPVEVTLDSYLDANVYANYRINERVSVFVKGSNLLSDNYQKWLNTPVQGLQVLAGATYKFNW
ncbi:MAG: TonB-dependent receptor [Gilvibacter sp.]